jgi:hypothetical protein
MFGVGVEYVIVSLAFRHRCEFVIGIETARGPSSSAVNSEVKPGVACLSLFLFPAHDTMLLTEPLYIDATQAHVKEIIQSISCFKLNAGGLTFISPQFSCCNDSSPKIRISRSKSKAYVRSTCRM